MVLLLIKLACVVGLLLGSGHEVWAADVDLESVQPLSAMGETTKDGSDFWKDLTSKVKRLNDYSFASLVDTFKRPDKPTTQVGRLSYKKENRVRVEVISGCSKKGAVVVRRADGLVRVKGGPILFGIVMTLNEDSKLLYTDSGSNVIKCDFLSIFSDLVKLGNCEVSTRPLNWRQNQVTVVDFLSAPSTVSSRFFVSRDKVPVGWLRFKDGRLFCRVQFNDLKVNQGLSDDLFEF